jgi:hypothetical protein
MEASTRTNGQRITSSQGRAPSVRPAASRVFGNAITPQITTVVTIMATALSFNANILPCTQL